MVNFRYHLVSIIAIFVALCIGVILGAGPLQQRLSDSLSPQTDAATKNMPEQLSKARADLDFDESALKALADQMLPGTLKGHHVVLLSMKGTSDDDVKSMREALERAGANISATAALTENWDSEGKREYRKTLSTAIADKLPDQVTGGLAADALISSAVVQVLMSTGPNRDLLADILTDASNPILKLEKGSQTQGSSLVLIGPRENSVPSAHKNEDGQSKPTKPSVDAWKGIAQAIGAAPSSGLIIGDASQANSLVFEIRHGHAAVTSIDSVGTSVATLSSALALPSVKAQERPLGREKGTVAIFASAAETSKHSTQSAADGQSKNR